MAIRGVGIWYSLSTYVGCGSLKNGLKLGKFYGMEWPWVGAFTDFRGSGYRNPVQILGEKCQNYVKSGNSGLV